MLSRAAFLLRRANKIATASESRGTGDVRAGRAPRRRPLSVRYRYDAERGVRVKRVELVVDEKPWRPKSRPHENEEVAVRVAYDEIDLRAELKRLGGTWDSTAKVWRIPYGLIRGSALEKRIV